VASGAALAMCKGRSPVMANIIRRNDRGERELGQRTRQNYVDPWGVLGELMRWDPFGEFDRSSTQAGPFVPPVDVRETPDAFAFKVDLPGVKEEDVELSLTGNRLTISGQRTEEKRDERDRYHSYECSYGSFSRSFALPEGTDIDNVRADMKNGVLQITVPKRPEVQPRRIALGQQGAGKSGQPKS
jgi:HSP20 family protein